MIASLSDGLGINADFSPFVSIDGGDPIAWHDFAEMNQDLDDTEFGLADICADLLDHGYCVIGGGASPDIMISIAAINNSHR